MFNSVLVANTEIKHRFLVRLVAFSLLDGVFRFIEGIGLYKINKISFTYGNELTINELDLHNEIH